MNTVYMSKNILIRDLSEEVLSWLNTTQPIGVSQNEYLRSIIDNARKENLEPTLFENKNIIINNFSRIPFKFIDLFAGIGGFRSAMTKLGGECIFSNEWDKYAIKTYQSWYRDKNINIGDINKLDISKEVPEHDILCAGFPCQPFSIAGVSKKKSLGRSHGFKDEKQGNLFFKILEIVEEKRPPILVLENVKNLKSHDRGNTWLVIESCLKNCNYQVFSKIIDAQNWVPQHRERIFIVCFDRDVFKKEINFEFPVQLNKSPLTLDKILNKDKPDKKYMLSDKLWTYLQDYAEKHRRKGNGFGYGLFEGKDISRTMSARYYKDGAEILIKQRGWKNPRRLTPGEAMNLMGFDKAYSRLFGFRDGFPQVVSDTQAYKQFGNAVVPRVVESIGEKILEVVGRFLIAEKRCLIKNNNQNIN